MPLKITCTVRNLYQLLSVLFVNTGFLRHNRHFKLCFGVIKIQPAKTLFGGLLEVFHQALITRVIGNNQLEIRVCFNQLAFLVQRQGTAMVGERMNYNGSVLTRFNHFIQVADRSDTSSCCQGAVLPFGTILVQQKTSHQVGCCHVFITGYGNKWPAQFPCHVLHKTGLATAGRTFQHHWHANVIGRFIELYFSAYGFIIRFVFYNILFRIYGCIRHIHTHSYSRCLKATNLHPRFHARLTTRQPSPFVLPANEFHGDVSLTIQVID